MVLSPRPILAGTGASRSGGRRLFARAVPDEGAEAKRSRERGAGSLKGGRYLQFPDPTPMANMLVSLLDKAGVRMDKFGDSTGPLRMEGLSGL